MRNKRKNLCHPRKQSNEEETGERNEIYKLTFEQKNYLKKIIGSWDGDTKLDKDIIKHWKKIKSKKFDFKNIFAKEYNLNDINKAINDFKD